jgi:hypothetical protein
MLDMVFPKDKNEFNKNRKDGPEEVIHRQQRILFRK